MKYHIKLKKTDEGFSVWCPGLPGCWSQGESEEEALKNMKEAIRDYIATAEELSQQEESSIVEMA